MSALPFHKRCETFLCILALQCPKSAMKVFLDSCLENWNYQNPYFIHLKKHWFSCAEEYPGQNSELTDTCNVMSSFPVWTALKPFRINVLDIPFLFYIISGKISFRFISLRIVYLAVVMKKFCWRKSTKKICRTKITGSGNLHHQGEADDYVFLKKNDCTLFSDRYLTFLIFYYCSPTAHTSNISDAWPCIIL